MLPAASPIKTSLHTEASTCPYLALLSFGAAQPHPTVLEDFFFAFFFFLEGIFLPPPPSSPWLSVRCELLALRIWTLPFLCTLSTGSFQVVSYQTPARWDNLQPKNNRVTTFEARPWARLASVDRNIMQMGLGH